VSPSAGAGKSADPPPETSTIQAVFWPRPRNVPFDFAGGGFSPGIGQGMARTITGIGPNILPVFVVHHDDPGSGEEAWRHDFRQGSRHRRSGFSHGENSEVPGERFLSRDEDAASFAETEGALHGQASVRRFNGGLENHPRIPPQLIYSKRVSQATSSAPPEPVPALGSGPRAPPSCRPA